MTAVNHQRTFPQHAARVLTQRVLINPAALRRRNKETSGELRTLSAPSAFLPTSGLMLVARPEHKVSLSRATTARDRATAASGEHRGSWVGRTSTQYSGVLTNVTYHRPRSRRAADSERLSVARDWPFRELIAKRVIAVPGAIAPGACRDVVMFSLCHPDEATG